MTQDSRRLPNKNSRPGEVVLHQSQSFSGPLPSPDALAKYEQVVRGAAERIIAMAEQQASHRQDLESKVIRSDISNSRLGLWFGLIIGLAGIFSGTFLVYMGYAVSGTLLGGATIVSLVGVFVYGSQGRKVERQQNRQKAQELQSGNRT